MDIKVLRGIIRIKGKDHKVGDVIKQINKEEGARLVSRGVAEEYVKEDEKVTDPNAGKKSDDSNSGRNDGKSSEGKDDTKTPSEDEEESTDDDSKK